MNVSKGKTAEESTMIPFGIKVLSYATALRWIGWGLCEALIPVLLYSLSHSYAESGLIDILGNIVFIMVLPFAGVLVDRIAIKHFVLLGLFLFVLEGFGFFFGAWTGSIMFVVAASVLDGVAVVSDLLGRTTYIRINASAEILPSTFGFSETLVNLGQLVGIAVGIAVASYLPLFAMFFGLIPTSLITTVLIAVFLPSDTAKVATRPTIWISVRKMLIQLRHWKVEIWTLAAWVFSLTFLASIGEFFLPIVLYKDGANTREILLASSLTILPLTFSFVLGKLADRREFQVLRYGCIAAAFTVVCLSAASGRSSYIVVTFLLTMILTVMSLATQSVITKCIPKDYYGRMGAVFEGFKMAGSIVGPIGIGLLFDHFGESSSLAIVGLVVLTLSFILFTTKSKVLSAWQSGNF